MESIPKIYILLILCLNIKTNSAENSLITDLDKNIQNKLSYCANYITKFLEEFNDRHIGRSEIGKMLGYDILKLKFGSTTRGSKGMNMNNMSMSMAMMPLMFQVGATSTWMMLTSIMAVKSVVIGLILLVFRIAVSSAKMGSMFTTMMDKTNNQPDWSSHYDHQGHARSYSDVDSYFPSSWNSYGPEANDISESSYKTIPTHEQEYEELEYKTHVKNENCRC